MHIRRLASWHAPVFLVNSRYPLACATPQGSARKRTSPEGVSLIPKAREWFAEFLDQDSLDRFGILYQTTSVGLGYGRHRALAPKLFSAEGITGFAPLGGPSSRLGLTPRGFACGTACTLDHGKPPPRPAT